MPHYSSQFSVRRLWTIFAIGMIVMFGTLLYFGAEIYQAKPPIPDALSYRFTYRGRQVETDTGELPDELRGLIQAFDELIGRYGA